MSGRVPSKVFQKDFYKVLNVTSQATTEEIKTAYRQLALKLHPDRHDGDAAKTIAFKEASEAYNILIDKERRRQYDMAHGYSPSGWYNRNRRKPPPANYRKVYAPHAPPDGKWHDAQRHYDMHYGDGMFQEAVKNAYERAKAAGELEYHSPLGKGFTFEKSSNPYSKNPYFKNPYSKADQGPPSQHYQYEEGYIDEAKTVLKRKAAVVSKLHERRLERYQKEEDERQEHYRTATNNIPGSRIYAPLNQQSLSPDTGGCTIM
ncbi:chaperone protein DnaJ [Nitzschia inconspicua]|uniref:Chaperone protein DnaJ n=1 Tax=Nitzschia inconspicua TaxID=303405 RepID=A0A9K3KY53_9STRA|nr:chaperone protein DnaJ [Nitzschia inconspicua]